ncbi:hypothetical protein [uncultured Draconibacterium sp.]|uniref:hypothetical protein n=1 Tax=uncultured Draconibacterium sp. TaxID=1573823 RepID=UPI00260CBF9B|nr:hypothetical protein [uncultured Draconibacterium sp.]
MMLLLFINLSCGIEKSQPELGDVVIMQKKFSLEEIQYLEEFIARFDTAIMKQEQVDVAKMAYHLFCEKLKGYDPLSINKLLQTISKSDSIISNKFIESALGNEIWNVTNSRNMDFAKTYNIYEINPRSRFIKLLKYLSENYPVLEDYFETIVTAGDITPTLIGGYHYSHDKLDFDDPLIRLWTVIHFSTIYLNSEIYSRTDN